MKKMLSVTGLLSAALLIPSVGGLAADDHKFGPDAARNDLKEFTVAEGLEVSLFASEPMVVNPANMDIDARGRVWVTEGANYRVSKRMHQKWGELRPGGDRINILEDTNGDGAADKQTTFYQDPSVNTALGVCVLGNRVIVSSSPYVFVLTDTNGDVYDYSAGGLSLVTPDPGQRRLARQLLDAHLRARCARTARRVRA